MADVSKYTALVSTEHRKPVMLAVVAAKTQGLADTQTLCESFSQRFDVDYAVGEQLDFLGEWIGVSRDLAVPIQGAAGLTYSLNDTDYRLLLLARIAANHWDGTTPGAYSVLSTAFAASGYTFGIQDYQDMTMAVLVFGPAMSDVFKALLTRGYLLLRQDGVRIVGYYIPSVPSTPVFGFGVENQTIAGFGHGAWAQKVV